MPTSHPNPPLRATGFLTAAAAAAAACCWPLLAACGDAGRESDSAKAQPAALEAPPPAAVDTGPPPPREPYTGLWTRKLLVRRLEDQGMKVLPTDSAIDYPHLSVKGSRIQMGRGDVHAFFYPDTIAPKVDAARLDSTTAAPPGVAMRWPAQMTLVRSLNLVAILLIDSPGHTERVANGILGGLPPPEQ